jgi:glycosyltransferase involved in cell wall biosynthesis
MAAGKPVVATNVGGAAEAVIEGETGFLVGSDDDETMSQRLAMLLEDLEKVIGMGEAARKTVDDKFSSAVQLSKTIKLYEQCLSN